jgi:hypothetical protein
MTQAQTSKFQKYRNLARFGALIYLIGWTIMQFGLLAFLFLAPNPPFLFPNHFGRKSMTDFAKIYVAATLAGSAHPEKVYDPVAMLETTQSVLNTTEKPDSSESSTYTPHMSALVAPLSRLPIINAYWLWLCASVTSAVSAMYLILRKERRLDNWSTAVITLATLGSINSMTVLLAGQTTWYMFLFFCITYVGLSRKNDIATGLGFALATIKPQYSFLYFAGLIAERRWRALIVFSALIAVMLAYAAFVIGWQNVVNYPQIISQNSTGDATWFPHKMCNVRALLCCLMPDQIAYKVGFAITLLSSVFVYKLWRSIGDNTEKRRWIFAITMLLSLTLAPHVNCYDCMLVGVPAILTLPSGSLIDMWQIKSKPYRWWCFLLVAYAVLGWVLGSNNYVFIPLDVALIVCGLMHVRTLDKQVSKPESLVQ